MEHTSCLGNGSTVIEFLLLGFQIPPVVKSFFFMLFLAIYIVTVIGNFVIVVTVSFHKQLQTPMYFFLVNLSLVEIFYTTTLVPTILGSLLVGRNRLSFMGCMTQFYFVSCLACNEVMLLTLMSYDRYVAICFPLHYATIMGLEVCFKLASGALVISITHSLAPTLLISKFQFFGTSEIDHFFCDFRPLINTACSDISLVEIEAYISAVIVTSVPLMLIIVSYVCIISTVLGIPSAAGRSKAFSTCSAHLIVVVTHFGTLIIIYGLPYNLSSFNLSKIFAIVYAVITPLINPFIYTLRNKDIKVTVQKVLCKIVG